MQRVVEGGDLSLTHANPRPLRCPIFVTKTAEGSSFEKAGLRTFDELLQFNDTRLDQFTEDRVAKMLSQSEQIKSLSHETALLGDTDGSLRTSYIIRLNLIVFLKLCL